MIIDNNKNYKKNYKKPWDIYISGILGTRGKKVIHDHVFENWPIQEQISIRKDYTSRRAAEKWAHYYEKKLKEMGKTYLLEIHIYGPATEIWW